MQIGEFIKKHKNLIVSLVLISHTIAIIAITTYVYRKENKQ